MTILSIANYSFNDFLTDGLTISLSRELKEAWTAGVVPSSQAEVRRHNATPGVFGGRGCTYPLGLPLIGGTNEGDLRSPGASRG